MLNIKMCFIEAKKLVKAYIKMMMWKYVCMDQCYPNDCHAIMMHRRTTTPAIHPTNFLNDWLKLTKKIWIFHFRVEIHNLYERKEVTFVSPCIVIFVIYFCCWLFGFLRIFHLTAFVILYSCHVERTCRWMFWCDRKSPNFHQ